MGINFRCVSSAYIIITTCPWINWALPAKQAIYEWDQENKKVKSRDIKKMFSNDKGYVVLYKHVILNVKLLVVHQIFKYLKEAPT